MPSQQSHAQNEISSRRHTQIYSPERRWELVGQIFYQDCDVTRGVNRDRRMWNLKEFDENLLML